MLAAVGEVQGQREASSFARLQPGLQRRFSPQGTSYSPKHVEPQARWSLVLSVMDRL